MEPADPVDPAVMASAAPSPDIPSPGATPPGATPPGATSPGTTSSAARPAAAGEPTMFVCVTCRISEDEEVRSGQLLHDALAAAQARATATESDGTAGLRIVPSECLSNCNRACTIALAGPGRWSYVHGDLTPDHADDVLHFADRWAASAKGLVAWRERPLIIRKSAVARIPPLPAAQEP
ncbi:DUF1636 domain-containing protein [Rhodoplanes azumiensis]|uniref:DUF1636 family protein n=1 Tax=Rhodoplanes azumiensis TaxID=1897628 RepID=A0ABW5ACI0_9BRAD